MQDCLESYIYKHTTKSQIIYITVLVAIAACLVALPLVYGCYRAKCRNDSPINERTEIRPLFGMGG